MAGKAGLASLALCLWAAGGAFFAFALWRNRFFIHDDAFISLRYAVNLVQHGELAWNSGERVEGFTNLLHLLLAAGFIALGIDPVVALRLIGLLSTILLLVAFVGSTRGVLSSQSGALARALGGSLLLSSTPLALWMLGGLEAVMLAALLMAAFWPLVSASKREDTSPKLLLISGILFALAFAVRPDAAVVTGAVATGVFVCPPLLGRKRLPAAVIILTPTIVVASGLTLWRLAFFGDVVPNTFHVKVGVDTGWRWRNGAEYLFHALLSVPLIGLALVSTIRTLRSADPVLPTPLAGLLAYALYVIWAGGDHMPGIRLLVPVLPLAALILTLGLSQLNGREMLLWVSVSVFFATASFVTAGRHVMDPAAFVGRIVGQYIANVWPEGSLVALNTAGSTPFYAPKLRFIDMLGLNDRTIARRRVGAPSLKWQQVPGHSKGDGLYVLSRRPDFIVLGPAEGVAASDPWFLSDLELASAVEFQNCYRQEQVSIPYDDAMAARGPKRPRPLVFTYYRRICG